MKSIKQKQKEATARQENYNNLSLTDRLKKLDKGGFVAKRERAKITSLMAEAQKSSAKSERKLEKKSGKS